VKMVKKMKKASPKDKIFKILKHQSRLSIA